MTALIASIPILLVIVLMIAFSWPAKRALPLGWLVAVVIALAYWRQDFTTTAAWALDGFLEAIGTTTGLTGADVSSVISMFYKDTNSAYAVLEISPSATDDEVRTAYRRMAMKNHPDKVATLGPDVQKAAAEKFRQIQEAYDAIKKERGMN